MDKQALGAVIRKHKITQVYHLAALLSAKSEQKALTAWNINMQGLLNVLEAARELKLKKVYWPQLDRGFWQRHPKNQHTPVYRDEPDNGVWHQQACGRTMVRVLQRAAWCGREEPAIPGPDWAPVAARRRHHGLCCGDFP